MAESRGLETYFREFEAMCIELGGRPHWGKEFTATSKQLRSLFPLFDRFDAIRRELDPEGMFENAFVRRVFATSPPA